MRIKLQLNGQGCPLTVVVFRPPGAGADLVLREKPAPKKVYFYSSQL